MAHIVLIGDSIFDNRTYTGDEPDVVSHLQSMLPENWRATNCAVDGDVAEQVGGRMTKIPHDASHLFVSVGGNNALMNADILTLPANSAAQVFDELANRVGAFESHYREMLKTVLNRDLPTVVCTIYYPSFPDAAMQKIVVAALAAFNDVIIRQAISHGVPLLDLRLICNEPDDYANEIEPSGKGGRKIAAKIFEVAESHDFSSSKTSVYF